MKMVHFSWTIISDLTCDTGGDNIHKYWIFAKVTAKGKPIFEMCCFHMGIREAVIYVLAEFVR